MILQVACFSDWKFNIIVFAASGIAAGKHVCKNNTAIAAKYFWSWGTTGPKQGLTLKNAFHCYVYIFPPTFTTFKQNVDSLGEKLGPLGGNFPSVTLGALIPDSDHLPL